MKFLYFLIIIFLSTSLFAQKNTIKDNIDFNGYIQIRGASNFDDNTSFSLRRLKIWIKSTPEFSEHWSYKVQTTFTSSQREKFFLQDVKLAYKIGLFSFDIGQFVPQYSLQRFQPDYKLPVIERALAINSLIPNGDLGIRDIGLQANFKTKNKLLETHFGVFNGYGIKEYRLDNQGYMLINKSAINLDFNNNKIKIGYSLQYREAENLKFSKIFPDTVLFTGKDLRYNFFVMFNSEYFDIQAEYLNADFDGQQAYGYYILSNFNFKKNQIVFSYEDYNNLKMSSQNSSFYRIGYNYRINKDKIKLFFDNYFQILNGKIDNYNASIQLQLFFK